MRAEVGGALVLAGSVLVAAGLIADAIRSGQGGLSYVLGGAPGVVGIAVLVGGTLKRAWDAIPVPPKKPTQPP